MINQFRKVMENAGIEPLEILADGKIHRFHVEGDNPQSQNGWYVFFNDYLPFGRFGCWKRGISEKWCGGMNNRPLSTEKKKMFTKHLDEIRHQREIEQRQIHSDCRKKSMAIWQKAKAAPNDHPYLIQKGIKAHGIRIYNESLIIPVHDIAENFHGIQFINSNGIKKFKTGTDKRGHFFKIGNFNNDAILICEGFATGASIFEATGQSVIVAFDANNLRPVSETIRRNYPVKKIIVCADNDVWRKEACADGITIYHVVTPDENTGVIKAIEAARSVRGLISIPQFDDTSSKPTDFNDLAHLEGLNKIRQQVSAAIYV